MPQATHLNVRAGDTLVLVGTMKGAFILRADGTRSKWDVAGPYFPGRAIYAMTLDTRKGRQRLWAAVNSSYWGSYLSTSDDFGRTWSESEAYAIKFPDGTDAALKQIWQIVPGASDQPDTLFCGVEPAALFRSDDAGATWSLVRGLYDHPHRPKWMPGGGGLCLHTILTGPGDSKAIHVAISSGGHYRSDDDGATWQARNVGVRADFLPPESRFPEFGQCVHKIARHPSQPSRLMLQNHWGLYRSDNRGDNWKDVASGVPSDFGFAMASDPNDADTFYIFPLESDEFRCAPEAKLRVFRTTNAGGSWEALTNGLPQEQAFESVLRDALTTDARKPTGVYFGTRSGKLFASNDAGASWSAVLDTLPPVVCVKTALL